jgi:hypothetical protein
MGGLLCGAVLLAGVAGADTPETQTKNFERFAPYLQPSVESIDKFGGVSKWQLVGSNKLVIWSGGKRAYLLAVEAPCQALQWNSAVSITSRRAVGSVVRGVDAVESSHGVGALKEVSSFRNPSDVCPITEIRPIDYERMAKDRG